MEQYVEQTSSVIKNIRCTHDVCKQTYSWRASAQLSYTLYVQQVSTVFQVVYVVVQGQLVISVYFVMLISSGASTASCVGNLACI